MSWKLTNVCMHVLMLCKRFLAIDTLHGTRFFSVNGAVEEEDAMTAESLECLRARHDATFEMLAPCPPSPASVSGEMQRRFRELASNDGGDGGVFIDDLPDAGRSGSSPGPGKVQMGGMS